MLNYHIVKINIVHVGAVEVTECDMNGLPGIDLQRGRFLLPSTLDLGTAFGINGLLKQQRVVGWISVVRATVGVGFRLQEVRTVSPVDTGERALLDVAAPDFDCQQTIGVGNRRMRLHIHGVAVGVALQHAHAHAHAGVGHQRVGRVTHYRLIAELFRCLRKQDRHAQQ